MSDVERLEKCKIFANANDIDWLIRTVEEQQKEIERLVVSRKEIAKSFGKELKECDRLRKALEFYADDESYEPYESRWGWTTGVELDNGDRAKQALKE